MNALEMARTAYSSSATPVRTNSGTEYDAFARVTHRIKEAAQKPEGFAALVRALHDNRKLWTVLAVDVADKANTLPQSLRAQIFYLAEFTQIHSSKVVKNQASPEILIEINTAIMRGLRQQGVPA